MKKLVQFIALIGLAAICAFSLCACSSTSKGSGTKSIPSKAANPEVITEVKASNGEILGTALDVGTYESFDEEAALAILETKYGQNIAKSGCTCVIKDRSDTGEGLLIGRNMDLSLCDRPWYKFELNYGTYKAMGIAQSFFTGPSVEKAKNGMTSEESEKFLGYMPLVASDYLNEKGLYIELNMRNYDYGENPEADFQDSKYGCTGTNPGKGLPNVCLTAVPFYVSTRCATVDEVLDLMRNDINIYNSTTTADQYKENGTFGAIDWNYAFVVADSQGNYGLIEVAQNKIVYTPQCGQANFYRNDDFASTEVYPQGGWGKIEATGYTACDQENVDGALLDGKKSRYAVATESLSDVQTVADMQKNMRKVFYSQVYSDKANGLNAAFSDYTASGFNPRYEMVSEFPLVSTGSGADDWVIDFEKGNANLCTFEVLKNMSSEKFQALFKEYCNYHYSGKTKAQLMEEEEDYWITAHSVVTDIAKKTWTITFFEGTESFEFTI